MSSRPATGAVLSGRVTAKQTSLIEPDSRLRVDRIIAQAARAMVAKVNRLEPLNRTSVWDCLGQAGGRLGPEGCIDLMVQPLLRRLVFDRDPLSVPLDGVL